MAEASEEVGNTDTLSLSNQDWYYGEMTGEKAEQALTASKCDCFLVRESEGALILSLIQHGQLCHFSIKHCRLDGYTLILSGSSAPPSFNTLKELVAYYKYNDGEFKILGEPCDKDPYKKIDTTTMDSPHIYANATKEELRELNEQGWYHGYVSKEQAEAGLKSQVEDNGFLVRLFSSRLILSMRIWGWVSHTVIHHNRQGYRLDMKEEVFKSVPDMIQHYKNHPIENTGQVLGTGIARVPSKKQLRTMSMYEIIFRKKEDCLKMSWTKCENIPLAASSPEVVKIGDCVYVGGGMHRSEESSVFQYNIPKGTWSTLPPCPTVQQGLATLNRQLIAIGGSVSSNITNATYTFKNNEWVQDLPPMPTPRCLLSTVSHDNNLIIAAGGIGKIESDGKVTKTDAVEIYIEESRMWFSTSPLPFPTCAFTMCIIDEACYIPGGTASEAQVCITLHATIQSLLENAKLNKNPSPWKQLRERHPLNLSSPVELDGRLVTMGGSPEIMQRYGSTFISTYNFDSAAWEECNGARLPVPLYRAGVVKLDSNHVMIVGGQPKSQEFSAAVYIGSYHTEEET